MKLLPLIKCSARLYLHSHQKGSFGIRKTFLLGGEGGGAGSGRGAHLPVRRHRQVPPRGTQAGLSTSHLAIQVLMHAILHPAF